MTTQIITTFDESTKTTKWMPNVETAKAILKSLKVSSGSWEYSNIVYPLRQQLKDGDLLSFYTEGQSTGKVATMLANRIGYDY